MKKIISSKDAQEFAALGKDENCLHVDEEMWRDYNVPALVPGMQTLANALGSIDSEKLERINYVKSNFQRMIPVESEVDFTNKELKKGIWNTVFPFLAKEESTRDIKISAYANGSDALDGDDGPSIATRVMLSEKPSFNEGESPLKLKIESTDLERFAELTNIHPNFVFPIYSLALSSYSIASRITHLNENSPPSWVELNKSLVAPPEKRKIPAYESIEAFFPNGLQKKYSGEEVTLRSAIRKEGNVYVIDTLCQSGNDRIYGARANLKQRRQGVIVKGIGALLDHIDGLGNHGSLTETIKRRREFSKSSA